MNTKNQQDFIYEALGKLARGTPDNLESYIAEVEIDTLIEETKAVSHIYRVQLDGNGRLRTDDFIQFLISKILEYAIPRKKITEALAQDQKDNSMHHVGLLRQEAKELFVGTDNTGEIGELLIFVLSEAILKLPQVLCKMSLKTNTNVHFHGADGLHIGYEESKKLLCLYICESKLHENIGNAISSCFLDVSKYLYGETKANDLVLLGNFLDLGNQGLEEAVKGFLDKKNSNYNKLQFRAICLVGFNENTYPTSPNQKDNEQLHKEICEKISDWKKKLKDKAISSKIDSFDIHVFMIPFQSVDNLRKKFLEYLE